MLTDNRIRELIHREFDDELTPAERAELQHCLNTSQEIRDIRMSLLQADSALSELTEAVPPADMKSAIMQQINPRPGKTPHWRERVGELYHSLRDQLRLRPAIPFALGTVAGIAVVMVFVAGSDSPFSQKAHDYAATLAHPSQQVQPSFVHEFRLREASGTVAVTQSDGISWVDIRSVAGSASIELTYDPKGLQLHVLNQQDLNEVSMKREEGIIRIEQAGESLLSLGFSASEPKASTITVSVASGGEQYIDAIVIEAGSARPAEGEAVSQ